MPDYKNADQVFEEARNELRKNHIPKADSLFRLAKELDVLRFRAPERINTIIDDLGKDFHVATIPIDSIFDSVSPEGIVGSNLIVDQLHPNVRGHQLIGRAFYDSMENLGYLPKTEKAKIPFDQQDSLTRANFVFTKLDSVIGNDMIILLKNNWPYTTRNQVVSEFKHKEFMELFQPKDFVDSIAMQRIEGMSWVDAHLLAATAYLRRDDIINYLSHINILIYQYPNLRDFDSALKYFYKANKIDTADYTTKRVGIITLYRGYFDDAIEFLTECSHSEPKDPSVFYYLSVAYSKKNDFQSALTMINTCLLMDSHYPEANTLKRQIVKQLKIN
jgi:tetratricopeptide (TPR) repeat protein